MTTFQQYAEKLGIEPYDSVVAKNLYEILNSLGAKIDKKELTEFLEQEYSISDFIDVEEL